MSGLVSTQQSRLLKLLRELQAAVQTQAMLASLQHVERIRKFSLQTEENKSVCSSHTAILEALLHGSADDVSEALESHLSRYKQSVAQARSVHPEYFIDE